MWRLLNNSIVAIVSFLLRLFRLPGLNSSHIYALLGLPAMQPLLERLGRRRAYQVYTIAHRDCPAYREFLTRTAAPRISGPKDFPLLPATTKENYVKAFPIEARCLHGRIPSRGVVIDESSGSSGTPNNWVRGRAERASVKRLIQHGFTLTYRGNDVFLLNCFALGPWATGMNVSMSLADSVILKSIGPDKQKLENTLKTFGPNYRYVLAGYPPFIKDLIDNTTLDLSTFNIHLLVGGEGITEGLRDHFLRVFKTVHSSYGASDLEINIAAETATSIAVRRLALADRALCRDLFGRDEPPMLFQYNPLDYLAERSPEGELTITLLRAGNISPKVRYNIRDIGGALTHCALTAILRARAIDPATLPKGLHFPFLFVYGRSDLTVPFYGCKVFTNDLDAILNGDSILRAAFNSFQIKTGHDQALNEVMTISLERTNRPDAPPPPDNLSRIFYDGLIRVNQDFREVSKMFTNERLIIEVHPFGTGPFAGRDIRIKSKYIA